MTLTSARVTPRRAWRRSVGLAVVVTGLLVAASTLPTASASGSAPPTSPSPQAGSTARVSKILVVVEENHSLDQMRSQMPYTFGLARRFAYADHYRAVTHPSLPNYLAISGGSTFGVTDDDPPSAHHVSGTSVFAAAIAAGGTARVYAEGMQGTCRTSNLGAYAVRHNPWTYFSSPVERRACAAFDVPATGLVGDVRQGRLPTVAMVVPDTCHDAHNCSLGVADAWFHSLMTSVLAGPDYATGRLAVVLVADEDDGTQSNTVLAVVIHPSLDGAHRVVRTPLTHYSLTRVLQDVARSRPYLGRAASAPDLAAAFGLPVG